MTGVVAGMGVLPPAGQGQPALTRRRWLLRGGSQLAGVPAGAAMTELFGSQAWWVGGW